MNIAIGSKVENLILVVLCCQIQIRSAIIVSGVLISVVTVSTW